VASADVSSDGSRITFTCPDTLVLPVYLVNTGTALHDNIKLCTVKFKWAWPSQNMLSPRERR